MCEILVVVRYVWPEVLIVPVWPTVTLDWTVCTVVIGRATIPATREMFRIFNNYILQTLSKELKVFINSKTVDLMISSYLNLQTNKKFGYELIQS